MLMVRKIVLSIIAVLAVASVAFAQNLRVSGVVVDETNKPVVGATVFVEGSNVGVTSGLDGSFIIEAPKGGALNVSFIGYESQKVQLGSQTQYRVVLKEDALAIESVSVIGYGTGNKVGTITGAVAKVDGAVLENKPTVNVADALQGQVAGMQVYTSSGEPSASSSIRLHGTGTLWASSSPLVLLDGAPISISTMNSLNPNDIESVNVLKDASATSVYGSRAANGVIYITTKKGQRDREATVTFNAQYGISQPASHKYEIMSGPDHLNYLEKYGLMSAGNLAVFRALNQNTNWREIFYDDQAPMYQVDMSVTGGSKKTSYYMSGMFMDQRGTDRGSGVHKYAVRANVETQAKPWLKMGMNTAIAHTDADISRVTLESANASILEWTPMAAMMWPTWDAPVDWGITGIDPETGDYIFEFGDELTYNAMGLVNPLQLDKFFKNERHTTQINATGFVVINPLEGLNLKSQVSADIWNRDDNRSHSPNNFDYPGDGWRSRRHYSDYTITYTNTIDYQRSINDVHNIYALAGHESIMYQYEGFYGYKGGQTSDKMLTLNNGTGTPSVSDTFTEYTFNSAFARLEYNYARKYFVDASVRYDESSRFGANNRGAIFWSVGAMWDVKNEKFMENARWINSLNVKASYGTQGNAGIDDYASLGLVGSTTYGDQAGLVLDTNQIANPDLGWETQKLFTAGFTASLWRNRVTVDFEFYNRKTENMLQLVPFPATSGYLNGYKNIGSLVNRGIDLKIAADVVRTKDWLVNVYANLNYNKNEITELFNGYTEYPMLEYGMCYAIGHSATEIYYPTLLGVDPEDGYYMWKGPNGTVVKDVSEAIYELQGKSHDPSWVGGFGVNARWKGISVAADFAWVADKWMINNDRYFLEADAFSSYARSVDLLDRWEKPGDVAKYGRFGLNTPDNLFDSHLIEDASFLRLKNLTVGYDLPRNWMAKTGFLQGVRVYFTARNLLTFTKYSGFDPEVDSNLSYSGYPNSRQFVGGIQLTF